MKSKELWQGKMTLDFLSKEQINNLEDCSQHISKLSLKASKDASTFNENEIENILDELNGKISQNLFSDRLNLINNNSFNNFEKCLGK